MKRSIVFKKILLITSIVILLTSAFIYVTPTGKQIRTVLAETISHTRYSQYAWVFGNDLSKQTPPLPKVIAGNTEVPVVQSSYCWGYLGCACYAVGESMFEGKTPTVMAPDTHIKISFDYNPGPTEMYTQQFQGNLTTPVPLEDGYIIAPKESGVYYYGISAVWKTDDGKYSNGDTSSAFAIEVK